MLARNRFPNPLPADAFVFLMSRGYNRAYLSFVCVTEGNDPTVYGYKEWYVRLCFTPRFRSYSDPLVHELKYYAEARRAHPEEFQHPLVDHG